MLRAKICSLGGGPLALNLARYQWEVHAVIDSCSAMLLKC